MDQGNIQSPAVNQSALDGLRWKKFLVLDDGFVCLVDAMGDDQAIVEAARVSYGAGTKHVSDDRNLIRYLMRHRHTTPFEMVEVKFLVRVPMDCWRQWIRHRTASVNEYSTRYSEAIDSFQKTLPSKWRRQSKSNKQGSGEFIPSVDHELKIDGHDLTDRERDFHEEARALYQTRLRAGVAREQARKDLPLSTYTEAYWKIDLHNLFHFLSLRMDSHAQAEIRSYAVAIGRIVADLFPLAWEAFQDFRLNGMFLSRLDIEMIRSLLEACPGGKPSETSFLSARSSGWPKTGRCRERDECLAKLKSLGIVCTENA